MSYDTGFSRRSGSERDLQSVAITSVDPVSRFAVGVTRTRHTVRINCAYATGDTITTPAVGEQWYCERFGGEWRLYGRIPFNDATLNIEPEEGQVSVGSASGPLELNGTEVRSNGTVFRLNGVYYRDDGETLQRSTDKLVWEPINTNAEGVIQLIGNALAGVPGSAAIVEYLENLSAEDADTLQAIADWASGLGSAWDAFCQIPFIEGLRGLGTGESPLDQVASALQEFINNLWKSLFCDFTGDLRPQALLSSVELITGLLQGNDFILGLADLLGENAIGNLLIDAIGGATSFLQQLVNLVLCDVTGVLTPQSILGSIESIIDPLTINPFIQGLAALADTAGTGIGNLFQDAIAGATELLQQIVDTIFCGFTGELTPQAIIAEVQQFIDTLTTGNPFIEGLEQLGAGAGNLLQRVIAGVTDLIQDIVDTIFCGFTGELTPGNIIAALNNFLDPLKTNPFVRVLASIAAEFQDAVGNVLTDAITGATRLLELVFNIVFCRWDQIDIPIINEIIGIPAALGITGFNPSNILDSIYKLFAPFNDPDMPINRILTGLSQLLVDLFQFGLTTVEATGVAVQDALSGLIEFFRVLFDFVTCQLGATGLENLGELVANITGATGFVPANILKTVFGMLDRVFRNPFFQMLQRIGEIFAGTATNFFNDAIEGGLKLLELVYDIVFCRWDQIDLGNLATIIGLPDVMEITGFNPAQIVEDLKKIFDVFAPGTLVGGFVQGLQDLLQLMFDLGLTTLAPVGSAARDALTGLAEMVRAVFRILTCDLDITDTPLQSLIAAITGPITDFAPGNILKFFLEIFDNLVSNSFVQAILSIGETGIAGILGALSGLDNLFVWGFKILTTFLPFVPWQTLLPFGQGFWDSVEESEPFNPLDFVDDILDLDRIPFLNEAGKIAIDFVDGLGDWAIGNVINPIVLGFIGGLRVSLDKLGISDPADLLNPGNLLGLLGDVAGTLLTSVTSVPAQLLEGLLPPGILGMIPVANIADVTPNLISMGNFAEAVNVESADGWSWDGTQNAPGSSGGSAKLEVTTQENHYLYSRQAVQVAKGDRLVLNASVRSEGLSGATPISIALIPFNGSTELTTVVIGSPLSSATTWTTIGQAADTYYEVTDASWTSVIVRLGVSSAAISGTVWWDEVSLTKTGLLAQNNVDSLIEAWNSAISGLFGFPAPVTGYDWTSLFSAGQSARQEGTTAQTRLDTTNRNLFGNELGGTVLANIGTLIQNLLPVKADGVYTIGQMLSSVAQALSTEDGGFSYGGSTVLDLYNAALQARTKANTADGRIDTTNNNLFGNELGGTVLANIGTLIQSLSPVKLDGVSTVATLITNLTSALSGSQVTGNTVLKLIEAAGKNEDLTSESLGKIRDTNTALFNNQEGGTTFAANKIGLLISTLANLKVDGVTTMLTMITNLITELAGGLVTGNTALKLIEAAGKNEEITSTAKERIDETNTTLFNNPQGGTTFATSNLGTLISTLANIKVDGVTTMLTMITNLITELAGGLVTGNTALKLIEAAGKNEEITSTTSSRVDTVNTTLFKDPDGGERIAPEALPEGYGAVGSGVLLRKSAGAYTTEYGPSGKKLPWGFYNELSAVVTPDMTVQNIGGYTAVRASNAGWYVVELSYQLRGGGDLANFTYHWGLSPCIYKSSGNTVSNVIYKFGTTGVCVVDSNGFAQNSWSADFCSSSFIVYLEANETIFPGYFWSREGGATSDTIIQQTQNGTYFSMSLLNRSLA